MYIYLIQKNYFIRNLYLIIRNFLNYKPRIEVIGVTFKVLSCLKRTLVNGNPQKNEILFFQTNANLIYFKFFLADRRCNGNSKIRSIPPFRIKSFLLIILASLFNLWKSFDSIWYCEKEIYNCESPRTYVQSR